MNDRKTSMTNWKNTGLVMLLILTGLFLIGCQQEVVAEIRPTETKQAIVEAKTSEPQEEPTLSSPTEVDPVDNEEDVSSQAEPTEEATLEPTATPDLRLDPKDWSHWPVVPEISSHAIELYQQAVFNGAEPSHFSKIGDCQNVISYFLADFDRGRYRLGDEYDYLQEAIDYYAGSWKRESIAVQGGFNVASVMSPLRSDPEFCESNESPVECEFRLHNPSIVIISMETWWNHDDPTKYEFYMRHLLDSVLELGALPILATKADNLEGDHTINQAIAQLAYEYDIPMWNFWAATDPLPDHGLMDYTVVDGETVEDNFHLTVGLGNYFDDPDNFVAAWPLRNLTALQTMDAVYQAVKDLD